MNSSIDPRPVEALWFPLVKKFYQAYYPSAKPNKSEPVWVIKDGALIKSAVRLKPLTHCVLLTGLVTHPDYRNRGYAAALLAALKPTLEKQASYCLNQPKLIEFYQRSGFELIENENILPQDLYGRLQRYRAKQPNLVAMRFVS
ncbi:GNAT family N-acetyltransferase [Marinomonas gallaica]|uniref:GNAT family N-acetyltransferase n=1 Tax=Marinomonas gallaica TaxID=1806667 RepID=UPI000833A091|nr:GNAT family N-acetyltransferase [Marinomonas gallaica]